MCTACAMSGSCRVLTPKHRCPLLQTWHDELWHCNVCHRDQEFRPAAASALPATAAAASLPTAKPAVVAQMATGSSEATHPYPCPNPNPSPKPSPNQALLMHNANALLLVIEP